MRVSLVLAAMAIAASIAPHAASAQEADCPGRYVVQRGDTLSLIAERTLGDVLDYRALFAANRALIGGDPAVLEVGTILTIPCPGDVTEAEIAAVAPEGTPSPANNSVTAGLAPAPAVPPPALPVAQEAALSTAISRVPNRLGGLIGTAALATRLRSDLSLQVIDIRPTAERAEAFVPRSHSMPLDRWLEADGSDDETLRKYLAENAIQPGRLTVIVASTTGRAHLAEAAMVAAILRRMGMGDTRVLWGGHAAWAAQRRPLWAGPVTPRLETLAPPNDAPLGATSIDWQAVAEERSDGMVLVLRDGTSLPNVSRGGAPARVADRTGGTVIAPPPPSLGDTPELLALSALAWVKAVPVAWEQGPVGITAIEKADAALAWFLASEVIGLRDVWLIDDPAAELAKEARAGGSGAVDQQGG